MAKFQPIPNFDSLSPQTTKGDIISRSTTTATRVAVGADNTVLTADSSQTSGVKWASASANLPVNTLTGATTLPATSQVLLVSGTTFPITLPSPTSNSGLQFLIEKVDTGFITPISISGTGFIGLTLSSHQESITLYCDGATYWPYAHKTTMTPVSFAAATSGTGFGTVSNNTYYCTREGKFMHIWGSHTNGTVAGSLGSLTLPTGTALDTNFISINNTSANPGMRVGTWADSGGANQFGSICTATATSTTLLYFGRDLAGTGKISPQNGNVFSVSSAVVSVNVLVPIIGWSA